MPAPGQVEALSGHCKSLLQDHGRLNVERQRAAFFLLAKFHVTTSA